MSASEVAEVFASVSEAEVEVARAPKKPSKPLKSVVLNQVIDGMGITMSFNEFTDTQLIQYPGKAPRMLVDADEAKIRDEMASREAGVYPGVVTDRLFCMAMANRFHPVREYLDGLSWDGTPRLDTWLTTYMGVADSKYVRKVGKSTLVAAVRRVRDPGCKFDEALVLVGAEGSGKSSGIRALSPDPNWVTDSLPISATPKQVVEGTSGVWLVESAEMVGMKNVEHVKAFLSRQVDGPVRMAYARHPVSRPRQFIVIGTTNDWKPLANETGARRFWPVYAGMTMIGRLEEDRDQLWAEANVAEFTGYSTFVGPDIIDEVRRMQNEFATPHPWLEKIEERLIATPNSHTQVPVADIWEWVGVDTHKQTREMSGQIAAVMRKLGYRKADHPRWVPEKGKMMRVYEYMNPFDEGNFDTSISAAPEDEPEGDNPTMEEEE
jgi:predicted P-loop ATPase